MIKTKEDERQRMAQLLGCDPCAPEEWPNGTINRLIHGEKSRGEMWLYDEMAALLMHPAVME